MPVIHLGVIEQPYPTPERAVPRQAPKKPRRRPLKRPIQQRLPLGHHQTTYTVALRLEEKYKVLGRLFDRHRGAIAKSMADEVAGQLVNIMAGGPQGPLNMAGAMSETTNFLKQGIALQELDGFPGIPTQASLLGINHRLKHPYARSNPPRPSFIDYSLYQGSIIAWFDP